MRRPLIPILAPALAVALAGGLYAQMSSYRQTADTTVFHARVRAAVEAIPYRLGDWEGVDESVPGAAVELLRPNVMFSRCYQRTNPSRWAKLIVIHSRDPRDMSGHYPPNCYSGSGWVQAGPAAIRTITAWGRAIPVAEYEFTKTRAMDRASRWAIFDLFVLPAAGMVTSMDEIYRASGNYRVRPFGAAQIQVIMDADLPDAERLQILDLLLAPLAPAIDRLQLPSAEATP